MLLGWPLKSVEVLSPVPVLPLTLVDLYPDLNNNIMSEPLVKMLTNISIKKLLLSLLLPQIMVVKLSFLLILLLKEDF